MNQDATDRDSSSTLWQGGRILSLHEVCTNYSMQSQSMVCYMKDGGAVDDNNNTIMCNKWRRLTNERSSTTTSESSAFFFKMLLCVKIHLQNNVPRKNPNNWNPTLSTCNIARPSSSSSETPFFKFDMLKPTPYLPRYDRAVFCVCIFAVFSQLARIPAISLHNF